MQRFFGFAVAMGVLATCVAPAPGQANSKGVFDDESGSSQPAGDGEAQRVAVPDAGAVQAATAKIAATYADDFKNSTKPQDKVFLSQKLQLLAGNDRSDALCYALLAKAKDLAIEGGSYEQAASVIDLMNERFDVDGPALKWEAVHAVAKTAGKDQQAELLAGVNKLAHDAMGLDRYTVALAAAQWSRDAAAPGDAREAANLLVEQVREAQGAYEAIQPALAAIRKDPHNGDANTAIGKFKCFFKGDWKGGLAMLAVGSDAGLKGLAGADLNDPSDVDALMKLGDGWWDVAQPQQSATAKDKIQLHAAAIYAQASTGLGGLAKADGRVQEAMGLHAKMSGTTALAPPAPGAAPAPAAAQIPAGGDVREFTVDAFVDGNAELHLTTTGIYWKELGVAKVGKHGGNDFPTYINGKSWMPQWGHPEKTRGNDKTAPLEMNLGTLNFDFKVLAVGGDDSVKSPGDVTGIEKRDPVTISDEAGEQVISIPDHQVGARWYRLRVFRKAP